MPSPPPLLTFFHSALRSFTSTFQVLRSVPSVPIPPTLQTLYILDSSFNPPTRAHLRIASSALETSSASGPTRLLLLLAINNADKAPKPASFEHRLAMMTVFAEDLLTSLEDTKTQSLEGDIAIDIGVTTLPFYVDKATAIASSGVYNRPGSSSSIPVQQIHLAGFDSLPRIFNPKYYPPNHTLEPLKELFTHHRLRVMYRPDDDWGGKKEQDAYLQELRDGKRENEGGKREWADRIELVEGKAGGEEVVSSTKARRAASSGDMEALRKMCTEGVADWVSNEGLYKEGE
ncbi:MAG: hypothetical protein Q9187_006956 [Circinaria calcarea]